MSVATDLATFVARWDLTGDLATYAQAIGSMFAEVERYAQDSDTVVGWQPIWDVDIAPHNALPWLAMMVGETIPSGSTDAQARSLIRAAPNQDRGTPQAIASAVQQVLTGTHIIGFRERYTSGGVQDDDALAVFTYAAQTPNVNAVIAALRATVPADIDVYYQDLTGPTWAGLEAGMSSWTQLETTDGPRWLDVEARTPGYVLYTS